MNLKKVIASAGALALGMAGLAAANLTGLGIEETTKRWSISASLGAFYDDNNLFLPKSQNPEGSFGIEFYPHLALNLPLERTLFRAFYDLRLNYYENRASDNVDLEHQFQATVDHRFSERSALALNEVFVSSSQPQVTDSTQIETTFQRGALSHWQNVGKVDYSIRLAPNYGASVGYRNDYYSYEQQGVGSLSALLDRTENQLTLEGQLFPAEYVRLFIGYQFAMVNYLGDDVLGYESVTNSGGPVAFGDPVPASIRDSRTHYGYIGGDRVFNPNLRGSVSVGGQYTDYPNQGLSSVAPYLDLSGTAQYLPGSSLQVGAKVDRNATDSGLGSTNGVTQDQLSAMAYISLRHRLDPRLYGMLGFRYQHSIFNGGDFDGEAEDYLDFSPGLEYMIRQNLYLTLMFTRTQLFTERPNSNFTRNRVYLGVRATF